MFSHIFAPAWVGFNLLTCFENPKSLIVAFFSNILYSDNKKSEYVLTL